MRISFSQYFRIIITYFLGISFLPGIIINFYKSFDLILIKNNVEILSNISAYLIIAISFLVMLKETLQQEVKFFKKRMIKNLLYIVIFFMILTLTFYFLIYIMNLFFDIDTSINQKGLIELYKEGPIIFTITTIILVPFIEEVVFRGVMYNLFYQNFNKLIGIVLSSLIFGLLHVVRGDFIYLPIYSILGAVLLLSYIKSNNLLVPILVHSLYNLFSILIMISSGVI
ncbi:CPBP family intramembrane metalloprotease [Mycoplasmatota bacterium]|nr:CPBP family intramembrane metalloprotease [Mycoplasmatota bacterium]